MRKPAFHRHADPCSKTVIFRTPAQVFTRRHGEGNSLEGLDVIRAAANHPVSIHKDCTARGTSRIDHCFQPATSRVSMVFTASGSTILTSCALRGPGAPGQHRVARTLLLQGS
jgi:hypothetical protein